MQKILRHISDLVFWVAFSLSVINTIAGIFGLTPAINWLLALNLPFVVILPFAALIWGALLVSWLNAGLTNSAGTLIYAANILAAPFCYQLMGIPYSIGLLIAALAWPFYSLTENAAHLINAVLRR